MTRKGHFRSSPRPQASYQVTMRRDDGACVVVFTRDVSTGGMFIETQELFQLGQKLEVELSSASTWEPLTLSAEVRRVAKGGVGLHFVDVSDSQLVALINLTPSLDFES
jgi:Tfp pilus assembly protein PilZ